MAGFYFHIGMDKTGTTSIQRTLHLERARLAEAGLVSPHLPSPNHSHFVDSQFRLPLDRFDAVLTARGDAVYVSERAAMRAAFLAEMEAAIGAGSDAILSAETASTMSAAEAVATREALAPRLGPVTILALVRPPAAYVVSAAQQALSDGKAITQVVEAPRLPRYRERFAAHVDAFGRDRVRLAVFAPGLLVEGCPFQTLLGLMDTPRPALADLRAARANSSMSLTAAKFLSAIHASLAARRRVALPDPIVRAMEAGPVGAYLAHASAAEGRPPALPPVLMHHLVSIPGPRFALPCEIAAHLAETGDGARWLADTFGLDVLGGDTPLGETIPAADFAHFDDGEVAAVAAALAEINAEITEPIEVLMERRRQGSQAAVRRYVHPAAPDPVAMERPRAPRRRGLVGRLLERWGA
ncbi:hypothetical protein [Acuticoccus mangrovi]|uniref:Uncharacterized protein n=1 Tax=Acuticoccus mangrovi TaxID=2796142 RepID=A0A934IMK6_9HYPH|nr:hypothetical protein [Acuticoccus mangrovi]MBJ3775385.1 hypothetical protein [Acuticoccus mangrovi]